MKNVFILFSFLLIIFSCSKEEGTKEPAIVGEWEALNVYEDEYTIFKFQSNHHFTSDHRRIGNSAYGAIDIYGSWKGEYNIDGDTMLLHNIINERGVAIPSLTYRITFENENMTLTQVDGEGKFILKKV